MRKYIEWNSKLRIASESWNQKCEPVVVISNLSKEAIDTITCSDAEDFNMVWEGLGEYEFTIHDMVHERIGMSVAKLSKRFDIPVRTIHHWVAGDRECSKWIINMMKEILYD